MTAAQSIPELVAAARANAKISEDRISELSMSEDVQLHSEDLRSATVALEMLSVDIFSVFEARMQHHFRRGPFSRKLRSLLADSGETELSERVHGYYLAINVLKHGKGASYRELLAESGSRFVVRSPDDEDGQSDLSLIDVTAPGFFDGITATILEAYKFLENRKVF